MKIYNTVLVKVNFMIVATLSAPRTPVAKVLMKVLKICRPIDQSGVTTQRQFQVDEKFQANVLKGYGIPSKGISKIFPENSICYLTRIELISECK